MKTLCNVTPLLTATGFSALSMPINSGGREQAARPKNNSIVANALSPLTHEVEATSENASDESVITTLLLFITAARLTIGIAQADIFHDPGSQSTVA
jgi:hypothetical protein